MLLLGAGIVLWYALGIAIIVRAWQGRFLPHYSFFFSYLIYLLVTGLGLNLVNYLAGQYYPLVFWLRFLTLVIAEFALLVEIGDHIFAARPVVRSLGRLVTIGITLAFTILYILPSFMETRPSDLAVLDLVKRSAFAKSMTMIALLAVARYYGVRLGKHVAGLALGLAVYLAVNTANFALAETFGSALYGPAFAIVGTMSEALCLLIWLVAFWRPEPAMQGYGASSVSGEFAEPLPGRLVRMNTALVRLFRK